MSDLREALEHPWTYEAEHAGPVSSTIVAAARRFLALTETGTVANIGYTPGDADGEFVEFHPGRYLIIPADYLTEEETKMSERKCECCAHADCDLHRDPWP